MSEDPYDLYAGSASDSSLRGGRRLSEHRRRDDDVRDMASAEGRKLFIGGLSWDTTDEGFRRFFERFGEIEEAMVMRDKHSGTSRGFGFVTFRDVRSADDVMNDSNLNLDGRKVDPKRAIPKDFMDGGPRARAEDSRRGDGSPGREACHKVFIGALGPTATDGTSRTRSNICSCVCCRGP